MGATPEHPQGLQQRLHRRDHRHVTDHGVRPERRDGGLHPLPTHPRHLLRSGRHDRSPAREHTRVGVRTQVGQTPDMQRTPCRGGAVPVPEQRDADPGERVKVVTDPPRMTARPESDGAGFPDRRTGNQQTVVDDVAVRDSGVVPRRQRKRCRQIRQCVRPHPGIPDPPVEFPAVVRHCPHPCCPDCCPRPFSRLSPGRRSPASSPAGPLRTHRSAPSPVPAPPPVFHTCAAVPVELTTI